MALVKNNPNTKSQLNFEVENLDPVKPNDNCNIHKEGKICFQKLRETKVKEGEKTQSLMK